MTPIIKEAPYDAGELALLEIIERERKEFLARIEPCVQALTASRMTKPHFGVWLADPTKLQS